MSLLTKHIFFIVKQFVKASAFFPNKHIDRHTTYTNRNLFISVYYFMEAKHLAFQGAALQTRS